MFGSRVRCKDYFLASQGTIPICCGSNLDAFPYQICCCGTCLEWRFVVLRPLIDVAELEEQTDNQQMSVTTIIITVFNNHIMNVYVPTLSSYVYHQGASTTGHCRALLGIFLYF